MNHPSHKENEVVGLALGNNSCNVDEHVYWPGKIILKLYLGAGHAHPAYKLLNATACCRIAGGRFKATVLAIAAVGLVKQATLWATAEASEEVGIGSVAPHATSVF